MIKLKSSQKVWAMSCYVTSARCQAYRNEFTFDPLFLFEGTSTKGPATSSSTPALSKILPLDVLRSTVAPAKIWLLFDFSGEAHFHLLNLHQCLYHPRCLEVKSFSWDEILIVRSHPLKIHPNFLTVQELHEAMLSWFSV